MKLRRFSFMSRNLKLKKIIQILCFNTDSFECTFHHAHLYLLIIDRWLLSKLSNHHVYVNILCKLLIHVLKNFKKLYQEINSFRFLNYLKLKNLFIHLECKKIPATIQMQPLHSLIIFSKQISKQLCVKKCHWQW